MVKRAGFAAGAQHVWARPDEDGVGLEWILPELKQENGLSVGAVGPEEHPDEENICTRTDTRAASSLGRRPLWDSAGTVRNCKYRSSRSDAVTRTIIKLTVDIRRPQCPPEREALGAFLVRKPNSNIVFGIIRFKGKLATRRAHPCSGLARGSFAQATFRLRDYDNIARA